jgi:hypothetical protein
MMSRAGIHLDKTSFRPRENVTGNAVWFFAEPPEAVEIILFWKLEGSGSLQMKVVDRIRFERPAGSDERPFTFRLPGAPYTGKGDLFSIHWMLEVVAYPTEENIEAEIVVSPTGGPVSLGEAKG